MASSFISRHGDVDAVVKAILEAMQHKRPGPVQSFSKQTLLPELIALIETGQDLQVVSGLTPSPGR